MSDGGKHGSKSPERPTLKTISRLSGLAVTTVSRALGDAPDIGKDTKEKVRRIAAEVGYVPNRAGVRLRTGRTNVIALILPTENEVLNMTPRLIASVAGALDGTGFHLVVVPELPHQKPLDPVRYVVETRSADAVILNRVTPEDERVAFLRARNFPFACHGRTVWRDQHAYFDYDNYAFGQVAVETLASRGRRSCIVIAPPRHQTYGRDLVSGVMAAAQDTGLAVTLAEFTSDDPSDMIAERIAALLDATPGADALICASPHSAMASVGAIEAQGHSLGDSFDIYAKETFPILEMFRKNILTTRENIEKAGQFLARAAIQEIRTPGAPPLQALEHPSGEVQEMNAPQRRAV